MVCFADRAGVEVADAIDGFIARHVGVSVQGERGAGRHVGGRFMQEVKGAPGTLQQKAVRGESARVAIAADGLKRGTDGTQFAQDFRSANVAEVPDFVGFGQQRRQGRREAVVGVGKDGDAHPGILRAA